MANLTQKDLLALSENLFNEAVESLKYGLRFENEYQESNKLGLRKQAIINFHRFTELILKHFIAEINPLLIFEKPFDEKLNLESPKTITFDRALNFFCHNAELGILKTIAEFDHNTFKSALSSLKNHRNDIAHFFLTETDNKKLYDAFSTNIKLIYLLLFSRDTHIKIDSALNDVESETLEYLIDAEKEKLRITLEKAKRIVDEYIDRNTPADPKERGPNDAPVLTCPSCGEETLILTDEHSIFYCPNCKHHEEAGRCTNLSGCTGGLTPVSFLSEWGEDENDMICDQCYDWFSNEKL